MTFNKQDLLTFAIGLGVAIGIELGDALKNLDPTVIGDGRFWTNVGIALLTAAGRYAATRVPELLTKMRAPAS